MATDNTKQNDPDLMIRAAVVEAVRAAGDAPAQVRMSVSSEEPVLTVAEINGQWQRVWEILDHSHEAIDMTRCNEGLVILDRHYGDQIGLLKVDIRDAKIGGPVEFCSGERAQNIGQDAAKGLRRNVSVGYTVDSDAYRIEGERDGIPVVRATRWMPFEASFEPVPADTTVGVNRAAKQTAEPPATEPPKERTMNAKEIAALFTRAAKYGIDAAKVESLDMEDANGARSALDALIVEKQGEELESTRAQVVTLKERKPEAPTVVPVEKIGGSQEAENKAIRKYSLMNVVRSLAGQKVDIGREIELSDEMARQRGKAASGIIVPHSALATRDFTVSGTSSASIETELLADSFIDLLRSKVALGDLGVTFMGGMQGNIAVPKQTGASTGYWVAESADVTESQPTLGQVTGTPHTTGALVDISRRMLLQSSPDAEDMVRNDIMEVLARSVQTAVFAGTGADGQPSAITNATGINNPSISSAGTPTYAEILAFIGDIMADNAAGPNMKWLMTAEVWVALCATMRVATYGDIPLLDPNSEKMLGYDWLTTEGIPANSLWFGDWSTVVVPVWGNGLDMIADTSTLSAQGGLRLVGLQDVDVMVRNGQKIAYNAAVTA